MIARNGVPQLLERPLRPWMSCHIAMQDAAASDFQGHEHEQNPETSGHRHQKIAGHDALRVIADKGLPSWRWGSPASAAHPRQLRPIFADRSWGNIDAELQGQFIRDALLSPGHVFSDHTSDELPNLFRERWAATSRLPSPVQPLRCQRIKVLHRLKRQSFVYFDLNCARAAHAVIIA